MINGDDVEVICPEENSNDNDEIALSIQKIMLVTLLEEKKININQYNDAVKYLETKYKQRH